MFRLAVFASGSGSNAEALFKYFSGHEQIEVSLLLSNRKDAKVIQRAEKYKIPAATFTRKELTDTERIENILDEYEIDYIVLAGFLLLLPAKMIRAFNNKIINIHPALLPAYGGKGMYGHHVHQAVFDNNEKESGMSIHLVNEEYDKGRILFQEKISLDPTDTPDIIASKVLQLEHKNYAPQVEKYILELENN